MKKSFNLSTLILFWCGGAALIFLCCARKSNLEKGIETIRKGEYLKAIKSLRSALHEDSLNPDVHYNLALAYARLDSIPQTLNHYLTLTQLGSNLEDDKQLKELITNFLNLEPYASSIIPMPKMNQFKGSFSPSGETVAVAAAKHDRTNIYLVHLDGTIIRPLTKGGTNTDPAFSPTGEYIVFTSNRDGDEELYLHDLRNDNIEKLTDNKTQDFAASFSPDGKEIVFISEMTGGWEIYTMNINDRKILQLTKNNYWDGFPKFSGDGKYIVFSSKRNSSEDIYRMTTHGDGEQLLYSSPADDNDPTLAGDKLFFKSNQSGNWELYELKIKDKSLIRLTNNSYEDWNPSLAHNGDKILLSRKVKKTWQLYFLNFQSPIAAELLTAKIRDDSLRKISN